MIPEECLNVETFITSLSFSKIRSVSDLTVTNRALRPPRPLRQKRGFQLLVKIHGFGPKPVGIRLEMSSESQKKYLKVLNLVNWPCENHFSATFGRNESQQKFRREISGAVLWVLFQIIRPLFLA